MKGHMMNRTSTTVLNLAGALLAVSVFASLVTLVGNEAHAAAAHAGVSVTPHGGHPVRDLPGIETTSHGVVLSSTLPHCLFEDGGPVVPCTWNVGPGTDGNGVGLAYVVLDHRGTDGSFDFVWASDPTVRGWHWSRNDADCVTRQGHFRCANGARGTYGAGR